MRTRTLFTSLGRLFFLFSFTACLFAQHTVTLSIDWQDDTNDLVSGATVTIQFERSMTSGSGYEAAGPALAAIVPWRTSYTYIDADPALAQGRTYYYIAVASDSNGNTSQTANEIAVTIPPLNQSGKHMTVALQ